MPNSIEEITSVVGATRVGTRPAQVDWLLTDSRSLCFPEETLFFALKTKRHDGHRKAAAADLGISERTLYRKIREYDLE